MSDLSALKQQLLDNFAWLEGRPTGLNEFSLITSIEKGMLCVIIEHNVGHQGGYKTQSGWFPYDKNASYEAKARAVQAAIMNLWEQTSQAVHNKRVSMLAQGVPGAFGYGFPP